MSDEFQRQTNTFFIQNEDQLSQLFDGPVALKSNTLQLPEVDGMRRSYSVQQKKQIIDDCLQVRDCNKTRANSMMILPT